MDKQASPLLRAAASAALVLLGFSLVVVASDAGPGPRISRRAELVDLIEEEDQRTRHLRAQLDALQAQLEAVEVSAGSRARGLASLSARIERLRALGGLSALDGPGVVVELRDSTLEEAPTGDPNDLVIHEQDLQAVVNALWAGGAEAIAINGERIGSTSAVRCVGNTLLLHGSVYAPPYRITALGDLDALETGLRRDPLVQRFRIFAEELRLGFSVARRARATVPEFRLRLLRSERGA